MKPTRVYDKRLAEFQQQVSSSFEHLRDLRQADERKAFNEELMKVLPEVHRYITRALRLALSKGVISHNKYRPDDFFDQLIIEIWDHFDDIPSGDMFRSWLFERAEKILEDMEVEEIFSSCYNENIDDYSRAEQSEMEENYSTDGDGDLVMLEDLDDISYRDHHYILKNIFLDDAHEDLMALMESDAGRDQVEQRLDATLFGMPADARSVFELATLQLFSTEEIALIKKQDEAEIEALLERARSLLRDTLSEHLLD
ncbi:RNA polymerase sigma factor [Robiginitalea sp. SC105]|uniref:RNA polymerase sigma factor n=1 Tax=Robiginitalea sp. SC105 TaxID=2762332 RepID=UPI00163994EF|nr:sigma-70 family RNA polymerase sigma factor [Robiginitalea sp. SC105]MBC2839563.1 sigma-70 family RNA polymerase sigma factor [Robiginitalea sp. SC105]